MSLRLFLLARSKCLLALLAWTTWLSRVVVVLGQIAVAVLAQVGSVLAQD